MTASQRAAALGRIAALESEVSSLRMRAGEEKDQVAVLRAKLEQAEKLLTATAAVERQQRSQIASLTRMLEQLLKAQSDLGTDLQDAILDLLTGNTGSSATSLIGTLLVGSRMLSEQADPPTEPARLALQPRTTFGWGGEDGSQKRLEAEPSGTSGANAGGAAKLPWMPPGRA